MLTYKFCNLTITSNIIFPELPCTTQNKYELLFNLDGAQLQSQDSLLSSHWFSQNGEKILSYWKDDAYHWLRFPNLADFRISANTKEISCYPLPEIPLETIRHLLLDQVLPRCLAYQGKIMLHASAVKIECGVLLFIGDSGTGKSTMAGNFHQAGYPAISDDCVWIKKKKDQIVAMPSYGGLRLWEDSLELLFAADNDIRSMAHYSTKKRVSLNGNNSRNAPVLSVIVLSPLKQPSVSEVILDPLSLQEAYIEIMRQTFQLFINNHKMIKRHMQALGRIVPRLPAFRLSMPHDYSLLPLVRQKILETLS